MSKGVVFSVSGGTAMVLEEGGQFRKLPAKKGWQKGDVVQLAGARRTRFSLRHIAEIAAGVALMVAMVGYAVYYYTGRVTTYISIDINPSITIGLNNLDKVISATSYNPDGSKILESVDVEGMPLAKALDALIGCEGMQCLLEDHLMVVAVTSDTQRPELSTEIYSAVSDSQASYGSGRFVVSDADWEMAEEAEELGVSISKLMMAKQAQGLAPDAFPLEELLELTTSELIDLLSGK